jgi:hypothetical protein
VGAHRDPVGPRRRDGTAAKRRIVDPEISDHSTERRSRGQTARRPPRPFLPCNLQYPRQGFPLRSVVADRIGYPGCEPTRIEDYGPPAGGVDLSDNLDHPSEGPHLVE